MDEHYESFYKQEGPFYPAEEYRMDSWKRAVQDVINDVIVDALQYKVDEREPLLLTELFKTKWQTQLALSWFRHETAYYLWLVQVSGLLLPLLERETGSFKGWVQYRKYPKAWSSQHYTLPLIEDKDNWKLYIFEKNPHLLARTVRTITELANAGSGPLPVSIHLHSLEDGHSNIYHTT